MGILKKTLSLMANLSERTPVSPTTYAYRYSSGRRKAKNGLRCFSFRAWARSSSQVMSPSRSPAFTTRFPAGSMTRDSPAKSMSPSLPTRLHIAINVIFWYAWTLISHSNISKGSAFVLAVGTMTRSAPMAAHVRMLSGRWRSKQMTMPTLPKSVSYTMKPSSDGV